jgi:hypothetical protein
MEQSRSPPTAGLGRQLPPPAGRPRRGWGGSWGGWGSSPAFPRPRLSRPKRAGGQLGARNRRHRVGERGDKAVDGEAAAFRHGRGGHLQQARPQLRAGWGRERGERDQLQRRAELGFAPRREQAERLDEPRVEGLGLRFLPSSPVTPFLGQTRSTETELAPPLGGRSAVGAFPFAPAQPERADTGPERAALRRARACGPSVSVGTTQLESAWKRYA